MPDLQSVGQQTCSDYLLSTPYVNPVVRFSKKVSGFIFVFTKFVIDKFVM